MQSSWREEEAFAQLYGSVLRTMFTLLLAISGGDDWVTLTHPLAPISKLYVALFTVYVVFMVFGCLNVLTGVFVAAASEIIDRDLVIQDEMLKRDAFVNDM